MEESLAEAARGRPKLCRNSLVFADVSRIAEFAKRFLERGQGNARALVTFERQLAFQALPEIPFRNRPARLRHLLFLLIISVCERAHRKLAEPDANFTLVVFFPCGP